MSQGFEFDIGFLGGGQLARMSAIAALQMGLKCVSLDPGADTPAGQVSASIQARLDDPEGIANLMRKARRVTLENEFTPASAVRAGLELSGRDESCLLPGIDCLEVVQDKLTQRRALERAGLPGPQSVALHELLEPVFPLVLKSRFGGYDGKGTRVVRDRAEFDKAIPELDPTKWLAESYVDFARELAVMVCRAPGETRCFPTVVSLQTENVCDLVYPADTSAMEVAVAAVEAVGGFGLFGVELFEARPGEILVNEIAPRPHNSGHYTLDWGGTSQFEQHIRLVMGYPLAETTGSPTCMANLLGQPGAGDYEPALAEALDHVPEAKFHWYGKAEPRPGRKMGHVNVRGPDCVVAAEKARAAFYEAWTRGPG